MTDEPGDPRSPLPWGGAGPRKKGASPARSGSLARALFRAELSGPEVRALPAQTLYLALKESGMEGAPEIVEIASYEQVRLFLDFDCWEKDAFDEAAFWGWLGLSDAQGDLSLLQKILKASDLKLIALLLARYVDVRVPDERTDMPPGEGYYTPDGGMTWLRVSVEDETRHFELMRLLALIFETDAELFYQIIAVPHVATTSALEEEAYQDRTRRLAEEGVPEPEFAHQLQRSVPPAEAASSAGSADVPVGDVRPVEPLVADGASPEPLSAILSEPRCREDATSEFTLLLNAFVVTHGIRFGDREALRFAVDVVKGILAIGIELVSAQVDPPRPPVDLYHRIGLRKFYGAGLHRLRRLSKSAAAPGPGAVAELAGRDPAAGHRLACLLRPVPVRSVPAADGGPPSIDAFRSSAEADDAEAFVASLTAPR